MHYAVDSGNCECIIILINQGGDPSIKDKQGKSSYDLNYNEEVQSALHSTPIVDDPSEIIAGSFDYPASDAVQSPNATNFISDVGEEHAMFDTFGIDKFHKFLKGNYNVKPIFNWLKEIGLEELYEIMCEAGYDDVSSMVNQMTGPLPINDEDLKQSGISKIGHRLRIIMKLEQDAEILPKLKLKKNSESAGLLQCCMIANNATRNLATISLREWLDNLEIGNCYQKFADSGFDNYECLILLMASARSINSKFLEEVICINNPDYRSRILKNLEKDMKKYYSTTSSLSISFDEPKSVACESCEIF